MTRIALFLLLFTPPLSAQIVRFDTAGAREAQEAAASFADPDTGCPIHGETYVSDSGRTFDINVADRACAAEVRAQQAILRRLVHTDSLLGALLKRARPSPMEAQFTTDSAWLAAHGYSVEYIDCLHEERLGVKTECQPSWDRVPVDTIRGAP